MQILDCRGVGTPNPTLSKGDLYFLLWQGWSLYLLVHAGLDGLW